MRTAACHCGDLELECNGEPRFIAMCHCESCQRRSGTSYNLGAWFDKAEVAVEGEERIYTRTGDDAATATNFHFCPRCGTNIYWEAPTGVLPGMFGVAVGCFADPGFPAPTISLYGKRRHHWLSQPQGMPSYSGALDSDPE